MQWNKLKWKKEDIAFVGEVRLHPHADGKSVTSSHPDMHAWDKMDWSAEAAQNPETGEQMAHIHDGTVDHIRVLPVSRPNGISVHAVYHDADGNVVRQDAHFQVDQKAA